MLGILF